MARSNLFHEKRVEAFNAAQEQKKLWIWQLLSLVSKLQAWMADPGMNTQIQKQVDFEKAPQAFLDSVTGNKSDDGKIQVIVNPSLLKD